MYVYYAKCLSEAFGLYVVLKIIICYKNCVIKLACMTDKYDFWRKCWDVILYILKICINWFNINFLWNIQGNTLKLWTKIIYFKLNYEHGIIMNVLFLFILIYWWCKNVI